jgi:hypothetical protein
MLALYGQLVILQFIPSNWAFRPGSKVPDQWIPGLTIHEEQGLPFLGHCSPLLTYKLKGRIPRLLVNFMCWYVGLKKVHSKGLPVLQLSACLHAMHCTCISQIYQDCPFRSVVEPSSCSFRPLLVRFALWLNYQIEQKSVLGEHEVPRLAIWIPQFQNDIFYAETFQAIDVFNLSMEIPRAQSP